MESTGLEFDTDSIFDSPLIEEIKDKKIILVIGASDTGKTTFIKRLSKHLWDSNAGIVDLDTGQSTIGPPATVSWGYASQERMEDFYFTGTTTPYGSMIPFLTGSKIVTEIASKMCERIIIDTTGLISGSAGRVLKQFKIDLLKPDCIICLERDDELKHIIDVFRFQSLPHVLRLRPSTRVVRRTSLERRRYRFQKFIDYLEPSDLYIFDTGCISIRFTRDILEPSLFRNRVVSLRDRRGKDVTVGVIEDVIKRKTLLIKSISGLKIEDISTIMIGRVVIDYKSGLLIDI